MVLPLPLNAVEHYMLADDSAGYPRCFVFVLRTCGSLQERPLRQAIDAATRRHPLLRALVEYAGDRPRQWIECNDPQYRIEWSADWPASTGDGRGMIRPFDLRHEPGVRFQACRGDAGDALSIEFHHACTDGIGAVQFVSDLLALYAAASRSSEAMLPPLDSDRVATRDRFGLVGWRRLLRWLYGSLGWLAAIEFLTHQPAALGSTAAPEPEPERFGGLNGFCSRALDRDQTSAVVWAAKQMGVTVNDLVLRDTFVTLQETIEHYWPERTKSHKRIMVPTNLRTADDARLPAANVVAMINLDRRPGRWRNPQRLLRVLHWELTLVKRLRLGIVFVQILHTLQTVFGSLGRFLPTDRCQATCVVSNLGQAFGSLDAKLVRSVEFYPPIRPLTCAAFGVLTYEGRMTVSLNYDATALTADQGTELLERLIQKLGSYRTAGEERTCAAAGNEDSVGPVGAGLARSRS